MAPNSSTGLNPAEPVDGSLLTETTSQRQFVR
jgi:hypothetical protein